MKKSRETMVAILLAIIIVIPGCSFNYEIKFDPNEKGKQEETLEEDDIEPDSESNPESDSNEGTIQSGPIEGKYRADYDITDSYVDYYASLDKLDKEDVTGKVYRVMILTLNDDGTFVMETDYDQTKDSIVNWYYTNEDEFVLKALGVETIELANALAKTQNCTYEDYKESFTSGWKKGFDSSFEQSKNSKQQEKWNGEGTYSVDEDEISLVIDGTVRSTGIIRGDQISFTLADSSIMLFTKINEN